MKTVFCTNGMLSKTLAVTRSLGRQGNRIVVGEKIRFHTSGFSKFCSKNILYPDPQKEPENFYKWLRELLRNEKVDVFLPMDDDTMEIAVRNQEELREHCALPVPPLDSYLIASDKGETIRLAKQAGIPHPQTLELMFQGEVNLHDLQVQTAHLTYPLVIKPRKSSGSRGVRIVNNQEELLQIYPGIHRTYPNPLLQEYIPFGPKFDICLLYDSIHRLTGSFVQKQIRNYPIERGPSTVHESIEYPEALRYAVQLMENLPWYGVVDVEFMLDPRNGELKLMEINPRFWSSVHLAIRCGVDFPTLLYRHALCLDTEPVLKYKTGVQGRALLPGDLLHYMSNKDRHQMSPSFWNFSLPDDTLSAEDPMPTIGFFAAALRYVFDLNTWRFIVRR
ncbi:ATP-grasp domain-containing protein [Tumebacillus sp. ITR2]|uniref:ATP-grasp domain-containing protein n=1 Tax=Tumebacillus amylolyticus TaxID=2801339 RepID=A0ABS1J5V1_9BACL|nr:ATP-grasp domain-containing protein [Tumebacillus amylolyticus]MBL0385575.1 ATP-grasp domain-containing protein [Tumebacillus amylolyticus]